MPFDLSGNVISSTDITSAGIFLKKTITDGLMFEVDAADRDSYNTTPIIVGAKIYSVYGGGLRSANYTVQYSDDNSSWTTAFTGVMSNNTSCGFQIGSGTGSGSVGAHRYWRYVEGSAVASHHPRSSRIILIDVSGAEHTIIKYATDNCSDSGTYIVGTVTYDFSPVWMDLSNNGNNFTLNSSGYNSSNGGSITMNGSTGHASIGSMTLTNGFTLEAWCYMSSTSSFGIFGQGVYGTGQGLHILYQDGSRGMIFGMYANDNDYQNNYRPSANTWYHWVFTYDGTTYRKQFFANCIKQTAPASVETQYTGSGQFNIGAIYSLASSVANGRIAVARGYNRVLERYEIAQNFETERGRFGV
jgi:hypothetical protein